MAEAMSGSVEKNELGLCNAWRPWVVSPCNRNPLRHNLTARTSAQSSSTERQSRGGAEQFCGFTVVNPSWRFGRQFAWLFASFDVTSARAIEVQWKNHQNQSHYVGLLMQIAAGVKQIDNTKWICTLGNTEHRKDRNQGMPCYKIS